MIAQVVTISANNDEAIGGIIAQAMIHEKNISGMKDLLPLLEQVAKLGQPLAVICEIPAERSDGRRSGGMSPEGEMY